MAFAVERRTKQPHSVPRIREGGENDEYYDDETHYSFQFNERGLPPPSNLNPKSQVVGTEHFPNPGEFSPEMAQRIRWSYKHKETFNSGVLKALALRLASDAKHIYPLLAGLELADSKAMLRPEQILLRSILPSLSRLKTSAELKEAGYDVLPMFQNLAKLMVDVALTEIAGEGLRITKRNFIFTKPFPSQDIEKDNSDGNEDFAAFSPEFVLACFQEIPYFIEHLKDLVLDGTSLLLPVLDWVKLDYIPNVIEPTFASMPEDHYLRADFIKAAQAVDKISLNPAELHKPAKKRNKVVVPYNLAYRKRLRYFRELREE